MITAIGVTVLLFAACSALHFGFLKGASVLSRPAAAPGRALGTALSLVALAHTVEALIYAGGFWVAARWLGVGHLESLGADGPSTLAFMDYYYFSLVNFTTLGRGDLAPQGHLRFMTGLEAFQGFLLITASGSYILQVMTGRDPFGAQR